MSTLSSAVVLADRLFLHIRRTVSFSCGVALIFAPVLVLAPLGWMARAVALLLLVLFVAQQLRIARYTLTARRQLMLDHEFLETPPPTPLLEECLTRDDHLWRHSLVLEALRAVRQQPPSRLLVLKEKRRHLQRHVTQAFAPLRKHRFPVEGLLLLGPLGVGMAAFPSSILPFPLLTLSTFVLVFLGLQITRLLLRRKLARTLVSVEKLATDWMLRHNLTTAQPTERLKPYVHNVLYQSRPWFARQNAKPPSARPSLREVA